MAEQWDPPPPNSEGTESIFERKQQEEPPAQFRVVENRRESRAVPAGWNVSARPHNAPRRGARHQLTESRTKSAARLHDIAA